MIRKATRKRKENTQQKNDGMRLLQQKYQLAYMLAHWKVTDIKGNLAKSLLCSSLML